jgi:aspartate aminotransferase-like enzyme
MSHLHPAIDPDGLLEYSVVFSDRSVNHMSAVFQAAMRRLSRSMRQVHKAEALVVVPGGGSFGMEAIARQFAHRKRCLVLRNGWFSYRWSQIFEAGGICESHAVLKAHPLRAGAEAPFVPAQIDQVVASILENKPDLVFAAHVETAAGMILPEPYLEAVAKATRSVGGLFVLDCVASGAVWIDMRALGVDVLLTAPQKGWSSTPCAALVLLGARALQQLETTQSSSFAMDLKKWLQIMQAYENGGHAYHATLPTDALMQLDKTLLEMEDVGLAKLAERQWQLGRRVRELLQEKGYPSVAAPGFEAPGVVVSYCRDEGIQKGAKFLRAGIQSAAGVPLMCDEPQDFRSFRLGLFGLDKLLHVDRTVELLAKALERLDQAGP